MGGRPGGGHGPLGEPALEPGSGPALLGKYADGLVGVDAVGATAVGHDVGAVGDVAEPRLQVGDWDGDRAADVGGGVFGLGAYVEHDHVAVAQPGAEVVSGDGAELAAVSEVVGGQLVEPGDGHCCIERSHDCATGDLPVRQVRPAQVDPFGYQRTAVGSIRGPVGGVRAKILRRRCRGMAQCNSAIGLASGPVWSCRRRGTTTALLHTPSAPCESPWLHYVEH